MCGLGPDTRDALDMAPTEVHLHAFNPPPPPSISLPSLFPCPPPPPPSPPSQMALWEKSMNLQGPLLEQLKALYGHRLPIEVRHYLANWMEVQSW